MTRSTSTPHVLPIWYPSNRESLNRQGINAAMIHSDRSQSQRTAALTGFQRGQYRVLVATDVAARGIHVQDIARK